MKPDFSSTISEKLSTKNVFFGEVVSIEDRFESRMIKVRVYELDSKVENNSDLPECYPMFPPFFHFVPKVGERVMIFLDRLYRGDKNLNQEKRYYLSTTISQPQNIEYDPYHYSAASNESDSWLNRDNPISEIPDAKGTYPEKDVIAILGRKNTDIQMRDSEVLIRSGRHSKETLTEFNRKDPAYIQLRHGINNASKEGKKKIVTEVVNIPAEQLITVVTDTKNRLSIKVTGNRDNTILESFSKSFDKRANLITEAKAKIREFQSIYPKWELSTVEPELSSFPKLFPNNQTFIKKEVQVVEKNSFDQFAGSVINIVAEKINLLSHKSEKNYNLCDPTENISADTQIEINSTAHPMVKGDILAEFLDLVRKSIAFHVHGYHGMPSVKDKILQDLLNYNIENLLNKDIRLG
jgi:hypothetical protein